MEFGRSHRKGVYLTGASSAEVNSGSGVDLEHSDQNTLLSSGLTIQP
jgi:hypothetical protein